MRKQAGFIAMPAMAWAAIGAAVVIGGLGIALKVQTSRLETVRAEYGQFKGGVEALGRAAAESAKATEMADKLRKDTADAENAATVARLNAAVAKLRRNANRSVGGSVPKAPAGSVCPSGQTCFDTAAYQQSIRGFDTEARRLADECAAVEADLNTARKWAQGVSP